MPELEVPLRLFCRLFAIIIWRCLWVNTLSQIVSTIQNSAPNRRFTRKAGTVFGVRFINPLQGGGFGSKGGLKVEPIAVALAFHTNGRPVRVKFNREETFISTLTRHEAVVALDFSAVAAAAIRHAAAIAGTRGTLHLVHATEDRS